MMWWQCMILKSLFFYWFFFHNLVLHNPLKIISFACTTTWRDFSTLQTITTLNEKLTWHLFRVKTKMLNFIVLYFRRSWHTFMTHTQTTTHSHFGSLTAVHITVSEFIAVHSSELWVSIIADKTNTFKVIANEYFQKNASEYFQCNNKRILSKTCKRILSIKYLLTNL